jgi:hypothetical protein
MQGARIVRLGVCCAALAVLPAPFVHAAEPSFLFRIALKDGSSLVSLGEPARVGDRVVFSMPTSASADDPALRLIEIPSDRVDWPRTTAYAESVRAARYLDTRAEADYTVLTTQVQRWLDDVALAHDGRTRLRLIEQARKLLADWPAGHYGYKEQDVEQMVGLLDDAIANLRARLGIQRFDLSLVASTRQPAKARVPLFAAPGPREVIEQTLVAARLSESPSDRRLLLSAALESLDASPSLPLEWKAATRASTTRFLEHEASLDRAYASLRERAITAALTRARAADVRGVASVIDEIRREDARLNKTRPDVVSAVLADVEADLDAARRLRLARDRWALRRPVLRTYQAAIAGTFRRLQEMTPALDDIKALAGSAPSAIAAILEGVEEIQAAVARITVPVELQGAHALVMSAAHLAASAASTRREAALTGSMDQAWNAASAASGALMLTIRARQELQSASGLPQLPE